MDAPFIGNWPAGKAAVRPVPLPQVKVGGFLGRRVDANMASLISGLESPFPRAFEALARGETPGPETRRLAADSDLYKWMEGAAYAVAYCNNPELEGHLRRIADLVLRQQGDDGYISSQVPHAPFNMQINHDLYIAGHFFEAAVAFFRATQDERLLEAAGRWADWLIDKYREGHPYFQGVGEREHPEIELALVRLYRATGKARYLDLSADIARQYEVTEKVRDLCCGAGRRHAVRTEYLLTAMAELYLETGKSEFIEHLPSLWEELVTTRLYVAGGIGYAELIPERPYDLPLSLESDRDKHSGIAETCASVGLMMFGWRIHAILGESTVFDVIETTLYNHFLGALSLDHLGIFYYNPLQVVGDQTGRTDAGGSRSSRTRLPQIHGCSCCMPNAWRFMGQLPEYIFSADDRGIFINLYTSCEMEHYVLGNRVKLVVDTEYPHDGKVKVEFYPEKPSKFALRLRIPGWCESATLELPGGESRRVTGARYLEIERTWEPGEVIVLVLEMPVRILASVPEMVATGGGVAFARGPIIYCLEQDDVAVPVERVRIAVPAHQLASQVKVEWRPDLLGGVNLLSFPGAIAPLPPKENVTYFPIREELSPIGVTLIPFYARANRSADTRWVTFIPQASGTRPAVGDGSP